MANNTTLLLCKHAWQVHGTKTSRMQYELMFYTSVFLGLLILLLNSCVVLSIMSQKRLRTPSFKLLIMLTVLNLFTGITLQPMFLTRMFMLFSKGDVSCILFKLHKFTCIVLALMEILTIGFINVEFYLAIVKPYLYESRYNQAWIALIVCWVMLTSVTAIPILAFNRRWDILKVSIGAMYLIIFIVMCVVFFYVNKEMKQILVKSNRNRTLSSKVSLHKIRNLASTSLISYALAVLLPSMMIIIYFFCNTTDDYGRRWFVMLRKSNAVLDPIIYCLRMKCIRKPILVVLRRMTNRKNTTRANA